MEKQRNMNQHVSFVGALHIGFGIALFFKGVGLGLDDAGIAQTRCGRFGGGGFGHAGRPAPGNPPLSNYRMGHTAWPPDGVCEPVQKVDRIRGLTP